MALSEEAAATAALSEEAAATTALSEEAMTTATLSEEAATTAAAYLSDPSAAATFPTRMLPRSLLTSAPSPPAAASAPPPPCRPLARMTRDPCAASSCYPVTPSARRGCWWCSRASAPEASSTPSSPRHSTSPTPSRSPATSSTTASSALRARRCTVVQNPSSRGRSHADKNGIMEPRNLVAMVTHASNSKGPASRAPDTNGKFGFC